MFSAVGIEKLRKMRFEAKSALQKHCELDQDGHDVFLEKGGGSGVSINGASPINSWFIINNLMNMDDSGLPPYWETSTCAAFNKLLC